ncbi:hypothetical protein NE172_01980 [Clostridium botulinum]|uniref:Uncharacterized protein n=1 Tax=Clostridium botulinum TaxID=1491 RepID=A0A6B4JHG6_CLOBO|nr:hypothetical protein [Clostridium botulinum]EES48036.1 NADPH-dependent f420 reductase [Clostridium botulinum E1 str. 'BoNT E Beluga']MBY6759715.1 hypothetical protein [Clostridium botulinum]MBY6918624.1 hypothetical protein [Clostridium botulinum]MCR1129708.1 hypothetical protein [Clostridium botulinum]NFJ56434.1 hypothetical protein [Clostridium botulinum]
MSKEILKIIRENDGSIDIKTIENINIAELYRVVVDSVAIVTELMLKDLDEVKYQKFKKSIKEDLARAVDEGYTKLI